MYSTIIHPTDLSDASIPALKTAHELAKTFGSKLLVCFVAHPPMIASGTNLTDPKTNETRDIPQEVEAIQPFDPKVRGEVRIITIDESSSIKPLLSILENMQAELLVLGMHKKKGISGWFGKSITEEVVSKAHSDVLVVREHSEED
jgi:nucleotide-binding universal stress UspA family protein